MNLGLQEASTFAPDVDSIFKNMLAISSVIILVVWIGMIYFSVKYRHNNASANRKNPPRKSTVLEVLLISLIFIFGAASFLFSTPIYYRMRQPPEKALEIDVIAKQWMWIFHDPRTGDQINELKVPLGRPVKLLMTSRDVIHSFFVPAFRLKQDILPGRYTSLWFTADKLGRFEVLCAQFCGLSHSQMRAVIEVVPAAEYDAVVHPASSGKEWEKGKSLFATKGCIACHDGATQIGPSLHGILGRRVVLADGSSVMADRNYLRRSILTPNAQIVKGYSPVMPTFQGQLTEEELLTLIRYISQNTQEPPKKEKQ
jgi:cytochrome c oxidase subunit 2